MTTHDETPTPADNGIGTLNEQALHAALKDWLAQPGDQTEVALGRYVIDIVRGDPETGPQACELIEIQTRRLGALKRKLSALLKEHHVRLVYPLAHEKWIVRHDASGAVISRRKSPKRGALVDVFAELTGLTALLAHPHLTLEVLLIQEEEHRVHNPQRGWRRGGWVTDHRQLVAVLAQHTFAAPRDLAALLPTDLPEPFTTADLRAALGGTRRRAQQMAYVLRKTHMIAEQGRTRDGIAYMRMPPARNA